MPVHVARARARPVTAFFAIVFLVSWGGGAAARLALWINGARWSRGSAFAFFPVLIISVAIAGAVMTLVTEGSGGLRRIWADATRWRLGWWYGLLLLPWACILATLAVLHAMNAVFTPNFFLVGLLFGVPAGFLEEIGWSGFALPHMASTRPWNYSAVWLGIAWALWHLPVVDSLGAASPHGVWRMPFALVFILLLVAERVIISWAVTHTGSLLLAQLFHMSATGSLVVLSPPCATPGQETLWYSCYAVLLWVIAGAIVARAQFPAHKAQARESAGSR